VQQLVNVLALPVEKEMEAEEAYYDEGHHSVGAMGQDFLMPHIGLAISSTNQKVLWIRN